MSSSRSASLRSSRTTDAPSRSSTSAIAAPIPREAPVTSARRPASGTSWPLPTHATWPLTYAERGVRKKRSVGPSWSSAPSSTWIRFTVAPRAGPSSLPSDRVKPSSARRPPPSTITRPDGLHPRDRRIEEPLQLDELVRRRDAGRVEDERLELLVGRRLRVEDRGVEPGGGGMLAHRIVQRRRGVHAERRERPRGRRREPTGPAEQHPAGDRGRVALELDRLRQAHALRDEPATGSDTNCRIEIGSCSLLQDRDDALAAGGADRDHATAGALLVQRLRQRGDDPPAGRGEGMTRGQRPAVDVQLRSTGSRPAAGANTGSRQAFNVATTCAANASWISNRSKSSKPSELRESIRGIA